MAFLETKDFLDFTELTKDEVYKILSLSSELKKEGKNKKRYDIEGKTVALIFNKPSTRTRVSFEAGIFQLGGNPIYLHSSDLQIKRGETISDTAKVLSSYTDLIVIRTHAHEEAQGLAKHASIPVVNALTDLHHPCQALADLLTIQECKERLGGINMAYLGDGNNVCHSLMIVAKKYGINMKIATPKGFEPSKDVVKLTEHMEGEGKIEVFNDSAKAASKADVLYTDVWVSMGEEDEDKHLTLFKPYQINKELVSKAKDDAIVMHCLPAHRGEEITADVIDSKQSVIFDQAENRLYTQKALLVGLIGVEHENIL